MAIDWYNDHLKVVIKAAKTGLENNAQTFGSPRVGPTRFDKLQYPMSEVIPQTSDQQDQNQYQHSAFVNFYFTRERGDDYLSQLETAAGAFSDIMDELDADSNVVAYRPTQVENFAGELDGSLTVMISANFIATTVVDWTDS